MMNIVVPLEEALLNLIDSSIEYHFSYQYLSNILLVLTLGLTSFIVFGFIFAYTGHSHCCILKQFYVSQWYEWIKSCGYLSTHSESVSAYSLSCREQSASSDIDAAECHDFDDTSHLKPTNDDDLGYNEEHYDDAPGTDFLSELYGTERYHSPRPPSLLKIVEIRNGTPRLRLPELSLNHSFSSFRTFDGLPQLIQSINHEKERGHLSSDGLLRFALNRKADFATIVSRLSQLDS